MRQFEFRRIPSLRSAWPSVAHPLGDDLIIMNLLRSILNLPLIENITDTTKAMSEITNAVCGGEITPSEGQVLSAMIENYRKVVETVDHEERIAVLEGQKGMRGGC